MLRGLLAVGTALSIATVAHAAPIDIARYAGKYSNEVAKVPAIHALIRSALGPNATRIADRYFDDGVDMPAELTTDSLLLLHACAAHDCGVNEVKIAIQKDGRVYANLLLNGKVKQFGDTDNAAARSAVKLP